LADVVNMFRREVERANAMAAAANARTEALLQEATEANARAAALRKEVERANAMAAEANARAADDIAAMRKLLQEALEKAEALRKEVERANARAEKAEGERDDLQRQLDERTNAGANPVMVDANTTFTVANTTIVYAPPAIVDAPPAIVDANTPRDDTRAERAERDRNDYNNLKRAAVAGTVAAVVTLGGIHFLPGAAGAVAVIGASGLAAAPMVIFFVAGGAVYFAGRISDKVCPKDKSQALKIYSA
jgi:hypothetical protein